MLPVARAAFLLLVGSLPLAKPSLTIGGLEATVTDFLFVIVAAALGVAMIRGEARLRWSLGVAIIGLYLAAMVASLVAAGAPLASTKLASQFYLLSLPVLVDALTDDVDDLRRMCLAWLTGSAVTAVVGTVAILWFFTGADRSMIDFALHGFGTLPPGNYPRLESTFTHPAMLCNYLSVSLAILMICFHRGWLAQGACLTLLVAILVTAAFTITPGLGGIALVLGVGLFVALAKRHRLLAAIGLASSSLLAVAFVAVAVVAPAYDPNAPFFLSLPGVEAPLAPSVRLMAWVEAAEAFVAHPLFGAGLGAEPIAVPYVAPSGNTHVLTDAHNVYLNVAMHGGLVGLIAILLLVGFVARQMRPWRFSEANLVSFALGFAWLNAFAYQGLTGSYEDARHLWLLLGLLIVSVRLQSAAARARAA